MDVETKRMLGKWQVPPESARVVEAFGAEWEVVGVTACPTRVRLRRIRELDGSAPKEVDRKLRFCTRFQIDGYGDWWKIEHVGKKGQEVVAIS